MLLCRPCKWKGNCWKCLSTFCLHFAQLLKVSQVSNFILVTNWELSTSKETIWHLKGTMSLFYNGVTLSVSTLLSTPSYSVRLNPQWWWSDTGGGCWCSYWSWWCILYRQTGNDEETQVLSQTSWPKHVGQDLLIFSITYKSVLVIEMVSNTFVGLFQVWLQPRIYSPWLQRTVSSSHWEWWGGIATFWTLILEVFCEPCNSHITV